MYVNIQFTWRTQHPWLTNQGIIFNIPSEAFIVTFIKKENHMLPVNPIIAAAAADIVVGMALYSDYTFGPLWTKLTGMKCTHGKDMPLRFAGQAVASLMGASAMYVAVITLRKAELPYRQELLTKVYSWFFEHGNAVNADLMSSMKIAGFLWLGLLVPFMLSKTMWEPTINWQKFALKSVFTLAHFLAMAAAIAYFG